MSDVVSKVLDFYVLKRNRNKAKRLGHKRTKFVLEYQGEKIELVFTDGKIANCGKVQKAIEMAYKAGLDNAFRLTWEGEI